MSRKMMSIKKVKRRLLKYNISLAGEYFGANIKTKFICYCGIIFDCYPSSIFAGDTKSCGCYKAKLIKESIIDLTDRIFDRLTVLKLDPNSKNKRRYLCECKCGKIKSIFGYNLSSGHTRSCGCWSDEILHATGENHRNFNSNLTIEDRQGRDYIIANKEWSRSIMNKDGFKCQICEYKGKKLVAHHLDGYHWCNKRRLDMTNGVTLCYNCHKDFHKKYGNKNNTEQQYKEYYQNMTNYM